VVSRNSSVPQSTLTTRASSGRALDSPRHGLNCCWRWAQNGTYGSTTRAGDLTAAAVLLDSSTRRSRPAQGMSGWYAV